MYHCLAFIFMVAATFTCSDGAIKTEIMTIQHYKVPCQGESTQLCYLVKMQGQEEWEYFYDEIQGLDYEWGYIYTLEVSRKNIDNPPQDASSLLTKVEQVQKKEAVAAGTVFELPLQVDGQRMLDNRTGAWRYFDAITVNVPTEWADLAQKSSIGVFQHGEKQTLILSSVK